MSCLSVTLALYTFAFILYIAFTIVIAATGTAVAPELCWPFSLALNVGRSGLYIA